MDGRRKIGQNLSADQTDDISDSGNMERVSDTSSSLDPSQMAKLQAKCDVIRRSQDVPVTKQSVDTVEIICDMCSKPFVIKKGDLSPVCPHCGAKHHVDVDLEEVRVTNPTENYQILQDKAQQEAAAREAGLIIPKDKNWQDSRKEQISLEPGSPEYREYLDDLMENDPMKEDDAMHVELESRNEDLVTDGYDAPIDDNQFHEDGEPVDPNLDPNKDTVSKQQNREISEKFDVHQAVLETLAVMAVATPTIADDMIINSRSFQYDIIHDKSVTADEYQQAAEGYVMESMF